MARKRSIVPAATLATTTSRKPEHQVRTPRKNASARVFTINNSHRQMFKIEDLLDAIRRRSVVIERALYGKGEDIDEILKFALAGLALEIADQVDEIDKLIWPGTPESRRVVKGGA